MYLSKTLRLDEKMEVDWMDIDGWLPACMEVGGGG